MIISIREKNFEEKAAEHLRKGKPLVFPTETVYGIGASIQKKEYVSKIVELKGREEKKPIAIMCASLKEAEKYFEFENEERKIAEKFFPAPLTLILKRKKTIPKWFYPDFEKLGLRIPNNKIALKILSSYGEALAVTSANKSGKEDAKSFEEAFLYFGKFTDVMIVDGGKTKGSKPSTVVEIEKGDIKMLREGEISLKMIKEALYGK